MKFKVEITYRSGVDLVVEAKDEAEALELAHALIDSDPQYDKAHPDRKYFIDADFKATPVII
ncbi:hypothetical protein [Acinetobacter sp. 102]|uniref:hypothetical protein n=1 Tax=Acinetobacter sp. 102 TaxID=3098766 RepID=UPI0030081B2B